MVIYLKGLYQLQKLYNHVNDIKLSSTVVALLMLLTDMSGYGTNDCSDGINIAEFRWMLKHLVWVLLELGFKTIRNLCGMNEFQEKETPLDINDMMLTSNFLELINLV